VQRAPIGATVRPISAPIEFPQEKQEQIAQDLGTVLKWIGGQRIAGGNDSEKQIQQGKTRKT